MNLVFQIDELNVQLNSLLADYPELADDEQLRADVLEGETNIDEVLERIWKIECESKGMITAIAERQKDLQARKKRFEHRIEVMRGMMLSILKRADLQKREMTEFTVSRRAGSVGVHIDDADAVPRQLCKVSYAPDKTAIKKQLDDGELVPGAILVTGPESVTVRTK